MNCADESEIVNFGLNVLYTLMVENMDHVDYTVVFLEW